MSRSTRLIQLIQALRRRRRPIAAAVLADELGVSLRTVYRDISALCAQGAPIEGEAGLGYVLRPGFLLPPLMLSDEEVEAVTLGLRLVERRGDAALGLAARDALAKIEAVLPADLREAAAGSGLLAGPSRQAAMTDRGDLALVRAAIRAERKLWLGYADRDGRTSERVVWPVALGFFDQVEVLGAWCEMRDAFRSFRLDRIRKVEALAERYPRRRATLMRAWREAVGACGPA